MTALTVKFKSINKFIYFVCHLAVKSSFTANTYRGSLIAILSLPDAFQILWNIRGTRHLSVNPKMALFKSQVLYAQLVSGSFKV